MSDASTARMEAFIERHCLDAEIISTPGGVPTVESAAVALGVGVEQILKTLVFVDPDGRIVIGIASGTGRVDRGKLATAAGSGKLTLAPAELVMSATGYAPGGVAPFDLPNDAVVVLDETASRLEVAYGGSGTDVHMMRVRIADIVRLSGARFAPILQDQPS